VFDLLIMNDLQKKSDKLLALLRGFEGEIVFFEPKVACKPLAIR
jgi:hypothetical protein